jgi:hypothetical protein
VLTITIQDLAKIEEALNGLVSDSGENAQAVISKIRGFTAPADLLDQARELALQIEDEEDRISFDDEASMSPSDNGTFVSCWFWVPNPPGVDCSACGGIGCDECDGAGLDSRPAPIR